MVDHVLGVILGLPQRSALKLFMEQEGLNDMGMLLSLDDDNFRGAPYRDANGDDQRLLMAHHGMVAILRAFQAYRIEIKDPIEDWTTVTQMQFRNFREREYHNFKESQAYKCKQNSSMITLEKEFAKGIKRDYDAYPKLQEGKSWDIFKRNFDIHARAQGVADVLDPDYVPRTEEQKAVYTKKNEYMMMVFVNKLSSSNQASQAIQQLGNELYPAQKIWARVKEHNEKSTGADMDASDLLTYLTSVRWGSTEYRWTEGVEAFARYFNNRLDEHERLKGQYFADDMKITLLANAIKSHPELKVMREHSKTMHDASAKKETYQSFSQLVYSTATRIDRDDGIHKKTKGRHRVHQHAFYDDDDDDSVDFDTPVSQLIVSKHDQSRGGYRRFSKASTMPKDTWMKIPKEHQARWDEFPDDIKALILESTKKAATTQEANLHNMSASDYVAATWNINIADMSAYDFLTRTVTDDSTASTASTATISTNKHETTAHQHESVSEDARLLSAMKAQAKQANTLPTPTAGTLAQVLSSSLGKGNDISGNLSISMAQFTVCGSIYKVSKH